MEIIKNWEIVITFPKMIQVCMNSFLNVNVCMHRWLSWEDRYYLDTASLQNKVLLELFLYVSSNPMSWCP